MKLVVKPKVWWRIIQPSLWYIKIWDQILSITEQSIKRNRVDSHLLLPPVLFSKSARTQVPVWEKIALTNQHSTWNRPNYGIVSYAPAVLRPTRATKPALIGATDRPEPHYKVKKPIASANKTKENNGGYMHNTVELHLCHIYT